MVDYTRSDWLLFSEKSLILNLNSNISTEILPFGKDKKVLQVTDIPEDTIDLIPFLCNTDNNNNYLYINEFTVYISNNSKPVTIPGLNEIINNVFRTSDITSYINGSNIHYPFNPSYYQKNSTFDGNTFSDFIDQFTEFLPNSVQTLGVTKRYAFNVYPDDPGVGQILAGAAPTK
jgi:hypothetical protein